MLQPEITTYNAGVHAYMNETETESMKSALLDAPIIDRMYVPVAGRIHWFLLSAPPAYRGRNFGIAASLQEAEEVVSRLIDSFKH